MYLMVLLTLLGAASSRHLPATCLPGSQDFLQADETDCSRFYFCSRGSITTMICPSGALFDQGSQDCIDPEKAACTLKKAQSSTALPEPQTTKDSPKTWIQATWNITQNAQLSTEFPKTWNQAAPIITQNAQPTAKSPKTWTQAAQTITQNVQITTKPICGQDTSFEPHPYSSVKYYICYNGRVIAEDICDLEMKFDPVLKECNYW